MIIEQVLTALETAAGPVVKVLQQNTQFKVIVLGFKKGMVLKEHDTDVNTNLVVIEGKVEYRGADRHVVLHKFDEINIALKVLHSVVALEDSICFLIKG